MPHGLRYFDARQMLLSPAEAGAVLAFFFPCERKLPPPSLTFEDLSFAQGLLVETLDVESLLRVEEPSDLPPEVERVATGWVDAKSLVVRFARRARPDWFRNPFPEGAAVAVGEVARSRVAIRYRAIWIARLQGAPLL
jgi:hypothetical protein